MDDDRRQAQYSGALHEAARLALAADGRPRLPHVAYDDDGYAYSDGAPLAQNDTQAEQLFYAFPVLKKFVRRRFPGAYTACDMLIYPERGAKGARAPDIFVAFGAGDVGPEGIKRNSYKLFLGEPVPRFVLEVLSGTTADKDLGPKRDDYAKWGIEEYWMFDPFGKDIPRFISAERLLVSPGRPECNEYEPIGLLPGAEAYRSDVLCLELRAEDGMLCIRDPETGEDLRGLEEEAAAREAAEERADAEAAAREAAERRVAAMEAELAELRRLRRGDGA